LPNPTQLADAYLEVSHELEKVGLSERSLAIACMTWLLEERVIAIPRRARPRDALASTDQVKKDVAAIARSIAGLDGLYARAVDGLEGSGAGDGGRISISDSDPTSDHTLDRRRAAERGSVRLAARYIGEARNALYDARENLLDLAPAPGFRQPTRADPKGIVSDAELRESIANQERDLA
jgi:hypothetical protein